MRSELPATLNEAIAAQPAWLQAWVMALVVVHLLAIAFVGRRTPQGWRVRPEAVAILASFLAGGLFMSWLYTQVGYVRLLGLAHLVCWTPAYGWMVLRRRAIGTRSLFGKYVVLYLAIAGLSLAVDVVDVLRYLSGIA